MQTGSTSTDHVVDPNTPVIAEQTVFNQASARLCKIQIAYPQDETQCQLWIGVYKQGTLSPTELFHAPSLSELFRQATIPGIKEAGPVMLSDATPNPPRYLYLEPSPLENFRDRAVLTSDLVRVVKSWRPQSVGFYFDPELMAQGAAQEVMSATIRDLIISQTCETFYLLKGDQGFNSVLNIALRLKSELEYDQLRLLVLH